LLAPTTTSAIDSPTIQERRISSTVAVQDGQTVALGGLIGDSRTKSKTDIRGLRDIPVVGSLFGTTSDNVTRTELLVLITRTTRRAPPRPPRTCGRSRRWCARSLGADRPRCVLGSPRRS
jgi:type II secretory pathway component GspD/PulD (secretin)